MVASDALLERELDEVREREADYRARLTRHRSLSLKLRSHAAMLREALRGPAMGSGNVALLLADVARLSSEALMTPRTSIWLFDEGRENLVCRFQLPGEGGTDGGGLRLATGSCPAYVDALVNNDLGAVAVSDGWRDPRTRELHAYLRAYDVGALLDIPILGPGILHGVVCHEHQGGPRAWQEEEIDFAVDVGGLVALVLEAERRISAEQVARGTEARYQHLVESLPVTVYSFQARTGSLDYLSPRVVALGGLAAEHYLVSGGVDRWVDAIEPDEREPVRQRLAGNVADGFAPELIYRIRLPNGERRWVRDTCAIVRDAKGRPIAIQGTLADITDFKQAELARLEIERRYRTLLENVDLLAVILDAKGRVEFVNDCFVRSTGFTKEEALGADGFDLVLPAEERATVRADFLESMRRGKIVPRFESNVRTRGGSRRRILWTNTLVLAEGGAVVGVSTLGVDISDRVLAETSQLEHQKLESLGRLAANVAHDFNNLLTIISGAAEDLKGPADNERPLEEIAGAVKQAAGLTKALLTYARREPIVPKLLSVDAIVTATLPMLQKLVGSSLSLSQSLRAAGVRVVMDETQLRQVILNLAGNAADATRGFGTEVRISTHVAMLESDQARARGLAAEGTFLVLSVSDDGRGMAADLIDRVFDPFFTTKEKEHGTGLGLAMCASIVRRANGFIAVESAPGRGATFRVHLPAVEIVAESAREPGVADRDATSDAVTLLLVEDNESIRNLLARILSGRGVSVIEAPDLRTARAVLSERRVDVLLTDGHLPDGDGTEWGRTVIANGQVRRVVLMSGSPLTPDDGRFDAVIAKPFNLDVLVAAVLG